MIEKKTKIVNKHGLHLRPGMILSDNANSFESDVTLEKDGMEVNAKSIMSVTMLAALVNDEIIVRADGPDEEEAVNALVKLIEDGFSKALAEK